MADELVADASVVAKFYFTEALSEVARSVLNSSAIVIAPNLVFAELTNVAVKRVRRGISTPEQATAAIASLPGLFDRTVATASLRERGLTLAIELRVSGYDAIYLALAEAVHCPLVTADERLVRAAEQAGAGGLVRSLSCY